MTIERPTIQRVHITVSDPVAKRSRTITVYNTTPEQVIDRIREHLVSPVGRESNARAEVA